MTNHSTATAVGTSPPDDTTTPLLEVRDLRVGFETPTGHVRAVDGVTLEMAQGETLGIVGESGSGKSVFARTVMRILPPSARVDPHSTIRFQGRELLTMGKKERRRLFGVDLAMVFQDPMTSLTPVMTIGAQLVETLRTHRDMSRTEARLRAVELLASVGIPGPEKRVSEFPHQLSGGMRQRVTIALAIACEPTLLIADEPTTALDVTVQHQILNLLQRLQDEAQMGVVLITHDLGVVAGRTDTIAVMYGGRIVEQAPTTRLFEDHRHPYTQALLAAIPRLSDPSHTRLAAIPGRPPVIIDPPPGCRFAPRCPVAQERCHQESPQLEVQDDPRHKVACFYPREGQPVDPALLQPGGAA